MSTVYAILSCICNLPRICTFSRNISQVRVVVFELELLPMNHIVRMNEESLQYERLCVTMWNPVNGTRPED
jgi:hypothetical protein